MSAATRLVLVRHGRVDDAWHGRIYGALDVPLAPAGEEEARRVAQRLAGERFDAVISSGYERTEFGAALLRAERKLARRDAPELREIDRGEWLGLRPDEVPDDGFTRWHRAPTTSRAPGGESLADVAARALPCLAALAREHAGGTLAVVAHLWVLRAAIADALGLPLEHATRLAVPTASFVVVEHPLEARTRPTLAALAGDVAPPPGPWRQPPHRS